MYESDDKMVSHPSNYQSDTGLEVIDVIEAFTFDLKGIEATDTGNIIKYACRWKNKNGIQDLKKIMWYTQHLIEPVSYTHLRVDESDPDSGPYLFLELDRSGADAIYKQRYVRLRVELKNYISHK